LWFSRLVGGIVTATAVLIPMTVKDISPPVHVADRDSIGIPAPALQLDQWLNSPQLEIAALRGKVVLIRWWTDGCPYCEASAPALRTFDRKYRDQGLVVIGVFHPKPPGDPSVERMTRAAERFHFTFPIALDTDWKALNRWWLDGWPQAWTSVSFLIDRQGIIRYVHPGGEYHEGPGGDQMSDHSACHSDYRQLERSIVQLLGR